MNKTKIKYLRYCHPKETKVIHGCPIGFFRNLFKKKFRSTIGQTTIVKKNLFFTSTEFENMA